MIAMENLQKRFRIENIETTALNGVSIDVEEGEFVSIVGPSGSGKSTLLNILGFIDAADSGSYYFAEEQTVGLSEKDLLQFRQRVGFIFQNFNLIDTLSVRENIRIPLLHKNLSRKQQNKLIDDFLERIGIMHRANHKPYQLSGGQQQRVAIARALVGEPKLLLADEPTGNLDSRNGAEIFDILKGLHQAGTTILMVTHNQDLADKADRHLQMKDGKVLN